MKNVHDIRIATSYPHALLEKEHGVSDQVMRKTRGNRIKLSPFRENFSQRNQEDSTRRASAQTHFGCSSLVHQTSKTYIYFEKTANYSILRRRMSLGPDGHKHHHGWATVYLVCDTGILFAYRLGVSQDASSNCAVFLSLSALRRTPRRPRRIRKAFCGEHAAVVTPVVAERL